jgi:hypothetical protein
MCRVKHCLKGLYKFEHLWELKGREPEKHQKSPLSYIKHFGKKDTYPLCKHYNGIIGLHFVNPCLHFKIKQWTLVAHLETKVKVWVVNSMLFIFEQQSYNKNNLIMSLFINLIFQIDGSLIITSWFW